MGFFQDLFSSIGTAFKAFTGDPEEKRVLEIGKSATAKILKLSESGAGYMTVNDQPLVVIDLEVYPDGEKSFKASIRTIISRLETSQFQPGAMVYVKYDPADKTKVFFDTTGGPKEAPAVGNTRGKLTAGKSGFAEILGMKVAKGTRNGNQLYNLTIKISGDGIKTYTYSKDVPLPEYAIQYFQIGKKYPCVIDKKDKTKVDMDMTRAA